MKIFFKIWHFLRGHDERRHLTWDLIRGKNCLSCIKCGFIKRIIDTQWLESTEISDGESMPESYDASLFLKYGVSEKYFDILQESLKYDITCKQFNELESFSDEYINKMSSLMMKEHTDMLKKLK